MNGEFLNDRQTALLVAGILIFLISDFILARKFDFIAAEKGYVTKNHSYFWYCFFFGLIGYLIVNALPDKTQKEPQEPEEEKSKSEIKDTPTRFAALRLSDSKIYRFFSKKSKKENEPKKEEERGQQQETVIRCPECGAEQHGNKRNRCVICGTELKK